MRNISWVLIGAFFAFSGASADTGKRNVRVVGEEISVPGERPFDAVDIFGDFASDSEVRALDQNKVWWERMVRGEIGKERFYVLCFLKDGEWKRLGDIRTGMEFEFGRTYPAEKVYKMLVLMAGRPGKKYTSRDPGSPRGHPGEGWLEKDQNTENRGISTRWRIDPSVLPLLYFLLMSCPEDRSCR